jgi:cation:H+ antiporter
MGVLTDLVIIGICFAAVAAGAAWFVDAAARIAKRAGVSELVIGLTIVAIGTSAPEFAVTIGAAIKGYEDLSVANVVGSNLFNLGFILGLCAIVRPLQASRALIWRDGLLTIVVTALLLWPLRSMELARWQAGIMVLALVAYLAVLILKREPLQETGEIKPATWRDGPLLLLGIAVVIASQHFMVDSAVNIARVLGLSEWLIGVTIVAAGTSIPELATSFTALRKGFHGISAGNLIGSSLFNLLGVLGVAGLIRPLTVDSAAFSSGILMLVITVLAVVLSATGRRLSRPEGVVLVAAALGAWVYIIARTPL